MLSNVVSELKAADERSDMMNKCEIQEEAGNHEGFIES